MDVLLHTCCAPCTIGPYERLVAEGHRVTGLFYNPNIHPFVEFRRRLKAMKVLQERVPIPVLYDEEYGLHDYLNAVDWRSPLRCEQCYRQRLAQAAHVAREQGFAAVTTTLLASTYQQHEAVARIGREEAERQGIEFLYRDWRPLAEPNHERAAAMRLYLQSYCGCVFSEWERFRDTERHVYRGPGPLAAPEDA